MSSQYPGGRIFGLDVMRATAGVMVMLSHTGYLVEQHWPQFPHVPRMDWVGIFFVLSGYLIGHILLEGTAAKGKKLPRFMDFMQRRWLRTLPNYFLFLLLNILLVYLGLAPGMLSHSTAAYAVFMQNFHIPLDLFFWESWSLAVEEWFYLLFPLMVFGLIGWAAIDRQRAYGITCTAFIALPVLARWSIGPHVVNDDTWTLWVHKLVITRLDAPGMGMLAAWIAAQWPRPWRAIRFPAFIIGLAVLLRLGGMHFSDSPGFMLVGYESIYAAAIALLLPLLASWRSAGPLNAPLRGLSLITYSLYLAHLPMLYLFGKYVPHPIAWLCALQFALFTSATVAVATVIYLVWERPFMRLRNPMGRWLRKQFNLPELATNHNTIENASPRLRE